MCPSWCILSKGICCRYALLVMFSHSYTFVPHDQSLFEFLNFLEPHQGRYTYRTQFLILVFIYNYFWSTLEDPSTFCMTGDNRGEHKI